jgi:hypothetical protein
MRVHEVRAGPSGLDEELRAVIAGAPPDVVLQLRVPESLAGDEALRAERLRALGAPAANGTGAFRR